VEFRDKAEETIRYIRTINRFIHMKYHELAQKYNLTLEQFHLLVHLDPSGVHPTIGEIAEKLSKAQNTVSEQITRLEEKELVERVKDTKDRRVSRVVLTANGERLMNLIGDEVRDEYVADALMKMDEKDVVELIDKLKMIIEKFNE